MCVEGALCPHSRDWDSVLQRFIFDSVKVKVYFRLSCPPPTPEVPESLKKQLGLTQQTDQSIRGLYLLADKC